MNQCQKLSKISLRNLKFSNQKFGTKILEQKLEQKIEQKY
jgi:hypothetical protein